MIEGIKNNPVVVGFMAFVAATIGLLIAFGVHVTPVQREAIEAWFLSALALAFTVRQLVTPERKLKAQRQFVSGLPVPPPTVPQDPIGPQGAS